MIPRLGDGHVDMNVVLLVITDGRDELLDRAVASADEHLHGRITSRIMYDDSGSPDHWQSLDDRYGDKFAIYGGDQRRGFGGAIQRAWAVVQQCHEPFVFHLEDDFTFNRHIELANLTTILDANPHVAQVALRRQPWNDDERAAGGIVEQHPDDYKQRVEPSGVWLEHRRFFTTNPSVYRRSLCATGWPDGPDSEGMFTHCLLADPAARFAFLGYRDDPPMVHHIGHERVGVGY